MIALLRGILISKSPDRVVVDVGGVGYLAFIPLSTFEKLPDTGMETLLQTHLHVREDVLQLFGFISPEEKDFFTTLTAVSGVGPKLGLAILSGAKVGDLRKAIESEDVQFLSRIPGLGKKTATKLIFELRGKLPERPEDSGPETSKIFDDALSALINLGYKKTETEAVLRKIIPKHSSDSTDTLESTITKALKTLSSSSNS